MSNGIPAPPIPDWLRAALSPEAGDHPEVRQSLTTALTLWERGDRAPALRWIQQAVELARTFGFEGRALALARAATDLEHVAPRQPSNAPMSAHPRPPSQAPLSGIPARRLTPTEPFRIHDQQPASSESLATTRVRQDTVPDPPFVSSTGIQALPSLEATLDFVPVSEMETTLELAPPITQANTTLELKKPHAQTLVNVMGETPGAATSNAPDTLSSAQVPLEPMRALRVAVTTAIGREWIVRPLDEGEALPEGAREALLIALDRERRS